MITEARGNLLAAPVDALVNTVNTQGVMGKGIALQFKRAFPRMFQDYAEAAKRGEINLGRMHVWPTQALTGPRFVINFPTKGHWKAKSNIKDIEDGLVDLAKVVEALDIASIAVPPLGCGNGGLNWSDVRPVIVEHLGGIEGLDVRLYPPAGAPSAAEIIDRTDVPAMTAGRAALVGLLDRYCRQALNAPTLIETQKLMYFLQEAGEPLRLGFEPNRYGPYADNLRHVLIRVEGHFVVGYGDGTAPAIDGAPIVPVREATSAADRFLADRPSTTRRMVRVLKLADGFESAYGMELLATVHWIASRTPEMAAEDIASAVADWSPRKARVFTPAHIERATAALRDQHWLDTASV